MNELDSNNFLNKPYNLKKKFLTIILPGFMLLSIIFLIILSQGSTFLIQTIYLKISENRSSVIDRAFETEAPEAWIKIQTTNLPKQVYKTPEGIELLKIIRKEVIEFGLTQLKIYGKNAMIIYSSKENQIGENDKSQGYEDAFLGNSSLIEKNTDSGLLYELYVKVPNNSYETVMEFYEPVGYLDKITQTFAFPIKIFLITILIILGWSMRKLVFQAQKDINYRTNLLFDYRDRLQELVSHEAANTLRTITGKKSVEPKRVKITILFTDIRGFTDYCESESPEKVVSFLNKLLAIVIQKIEEHQGDIDKLIGDAVLAFFQGENAETYAIKAAEEILKNLAKEDLPRSVGIGIYTGEVVMGTIGSSHRKDFTVIGDAVNVASRLCSAAKENEIIIDTETCKVAQMKKIKMEKLFVKGKVNSINICRINRDY